MRSNRLHARRIRQVGIQLEATVIYVWLLILIQQNDAGTVKTPGNVYATSELCFAQKEALESQHPDWVLSCDRKEVVVK